MDQSLKSNGRPLKNTEIKTPLVVSFSLGVVIHFPPLAAFSCQGSSKDSHYFEDSFSKTLS